MGRILCLGDSNTYGYDPRSLFGGRYPDGVRWTGLLQSTEREIVNCGRNGLCIPREAQFPALYDLLRRAGTADTLVVMLGSNDLLGGAPAEDAAARMETLLRFLAEHAPGARILLIAPPPMRFGDWVQSQALIDESVRFAALCRQLADKLGISFADAGEWDVTTAFDGVHFSPEGHAAFAAGLAAALDRTQRQRTERNAL
ncbi:MAG: lipase [Ruminococcaceae bacterium]|nr:lipase [Oscillospiraceae bacterium]